MREPVFILTPDRTLGALACAMLGNHPDMIGLPDCNLFVTDAREGLQQFIGKDQRLQDGLLRTIAELGLGEQTAHSIDLARAWLDEYSTLSGADLLNDIRTLSHPRQVVEASSLHVCLDGSVRRMRDAFPGAFYLHLSLHPRLTCQTYGTRTVIRDSELAKVRDDQPPDPEAIWLRPHTRILNAMADVATHQKMILRGEDLLANPERYLVMIGRWLGIPTDSARVAPMLRPEESPFARRGPSNAPGGVDPRFISRSALAQCRDAILVRPEPGDPAVRPAYSAGLKQLAALLGYRDQTLVTDS
jgi:hypothetical protein